MEEHGSFFKALYIIGYQIDKFPSVHRGRIQSASRQCEKMIKNHSNCRSAEGIPQPHGIVKHYMMSKSLANVQYTEHKSQQKNVLRRGVFILQIIEKHSEEYWGGHTKSTFQECQNGCQSEYKTLSLGQCDHQARDDSTARTATK